MKELRLLHIEDSENDSVLLRHHLARSGYKLEFERVETLADLKASLDRQSWDVIISDYVLPEFSAPAALAVLKARSLDVPFIIISGAIGEETAVAAMRAGAHDYLMKDNLTRLVPAIERELHDCQIRRERKRAEEALRASEKLASLGRLAASIAHEVNNPLEAITNLLYLLGHCEIDQSAREYLRIAEQEVERVTAIVRQALSFSRTSTEQVAVPASQLVNEVLRLYSHRIQGSDVAIEERLDYDAPVPSELRQVVSNLVVNAVEAVGHGGRVWLHVHRGCDPHETRCRGIRITVADNGSGITPEHRRDLFKPFFTTKRNQGNGLGLWISHEIVQKHGGAIHVRSRVGPDKHGTVFSIFLPLRQPVAAASAAH